MFRAKQLAIFVSLLAAVAPRETTSFSLLGPLSRVRGWVSRSREAMPEIATEIPPPPTAIFYRNGNEDELFAPTRALNSNVEQSIPLQASPDLAVRIISLPNQFELPRRLDPMARMRTRMLGEMEILLGRIAMVAAVIFLAVEVTTGQSLPDQILSVTSPLA